VTRLCLVIALAACSKPSGPPPLRVAAASDLAHAFEEIAHAFETKTGTKVQVELGASGLLAKQIELGAPYALFAAANKSYIDIVVTAGRCDGATAQLYSRGRIVLWSKAQSPATLADLVDPKFKKVAIANPETAPYGKAAKQALEKANLWAQLADRIVFGDSIQATMQLAQTDNVDAAIVALSLATDTPGGHVAAIDPALYAPLEQQMVVCGSGKGADDARALEQFIQSADGQAIMNRHGLSSGGEAAPAK